MATENKKAELASMFGGARPAGGAGLGNLFQGTRILGVSARGTVEKIAKAEAAHVHGPGCNHGPDEHDAGDEPGHVHGPGCNHGPKKRAARPPQTRAAETGGSAVQFSLDDLLPEETDDQGIFEHFANGLRGHRGVTEVHIRRDAGRPEVCIHHDAQIGTAMLIDVVRAHGANVTKKYERTTWFVRGLTSADAAAPLETMIEKLPGVLCASVAYGAERVIVEWDTEVTNPETIHERVRSMGYSLEVPVHGKACSMHAHGGGLAPWLQMPLAIGAGITLAVAFTMEKLAASAVPAVVPFTMYVVALVAAAIFPLRAALNAIRALQPDVETLMILAGVGAAVLGAWFEGAFLLFLFTLGHALEHRAMDKARRTIESLSELTTRTARIKRSDQVIEVPVETIAIGDVVIVRAGDRIPLDGVIRDGESMVDQATITGESVPVSRGPNDKVFAGTINTEAAIEVEVTSLAGDTLLARIVDMVTEAEAAKSSTQRFVQRLERRFVPIVLVVAFAVPLILIATGMDWRAAVFRGVALIVAASPCALAISTPSAVLAAVARAARGGVLIKGGAHLESLGKVRAIAFDKTGTLTHGKPKLITVTTFNGVAEGELLATAAGLEGLSSHPLAKAVLDGAKARGATPLAAEDGDAVHGKGIQGKVGGKPCRIGNLAMFAADTIPADVTSAAAALEEKGQTTMIVWRDGQFIGVLGVADTVREEAKAALAALAKLGVSTTIMLSGDNERVAKAIAGTVGITEVRAPLLPQGKVDAIRKLANDGGVAMIGDGVNDAPALAVASVGVAMGGTAADATLETADVVLLDDSLTRLPFAVGLSRRATAVIRQNVLIAVGVSAMLVIASAFGLTSIAQAVVLHEGSTLLVIGNALLLLRYSG